MENQNNRENNENINIYQDYYSCDECNKTPKIVYIDYKKNDIQFNCDEHKIKTLTLNQFLKSIKENNKCHKCYKVMINHNLLKYCINCNINLCTKCSIDHINKSINHTIVNNEDYNIKCKYHNDEFYIGYCTTCKENICNECKRTRIHREHQKFDYMEIHPTKNDFEIIKTFNNQIGNELNNFKNNYNIQLIENEKINSINIIVEKFNKLKGDIDIKYENIIHNLYKEKERELYNNDEQKKKEINNILLKYKQQKAEHENNFKNYIEKYKNIIQLNNLIVNSYKKQKDNNLYYNENINKVIESINKYNEIEQIQNIKEIKEKYNILINKEKTTLKIKNDKIDDIIINKIFKFKFNDLKEISISSSLLTSINFLSNNNVSHLEKLIIIKCPIKDISIFSKINFKSLIELKISNGNINNINVLAGDNFINLKNLDLSKNKISDINIFKDSKFNQNLQELYLNDNIINDISVFNNAIFSKLKVLFLSNNLISNILPLRFILINNCESLSLENNKIIYINIFKDINCFWRLKNLSLLNNNPIDLNNEDNQKIIKIFKEKSINFY